MLFARKRVKEAKLEVKEAKPKGKKARIKKNAVKFGMKKKLLICFIGLVAVFCLLITVVLNFRCANFLEKQATKEIDAKLTVFQLLLEEQEALLRSLCESLKYEFMDLLTEGNRKDIESALRPFHGVYKNTYGITHMQLNDSNLRVLASIHDPDSYGKDGSKRPLLKKALGYGSGRVVSGFEISEDGLLVLNSAGPVASYSTQFSGIVEIGRAIDNDYLDQIKEKVGVDFTVFKNNERIATTIFDEEGNRAVGTTIDHPEILEEVLNQGGRWTGRLQITGSNSLFGSYTAIRDAEDNIIGMLFAGTPTLLYDNLQSQNRNIAFGLLAVAIIITSVVSVLFANNIVRPLTELSKVFSSVAEGDFTVTVKKYGSDEVGLMGRAVAQMVENLRGFVVQIGELAGKVDNLSRGVSETAENISTSIQDVAGSTNEVASSTGLLSSLSQDMSEEAAETAEKASSSQNEMEKAFEQMKAIEGSFQELKVTIDKFGQRSAEIGEIIQVINEISEQTNLLALNAAIEAARAGNYGRGFAVVADEVRKLAERSYASTEEIVRLISDTQKDAALAVQGMDRSAAAVDSGRLAMLKSSEAFGEIVASIQKLMTKIEEVAASSQELSASSEEVAASTQEQSAAVEEIAAATEELENASAALYEELKKFNY
ncbi:MAG: HAMP domain-containing protein [Firmicutes bacterium]|nr:HAMP domain-containing protein [Bacillota bacterium]